MIDSYLVTEGTVITAKGDSVALDLSTAANRTFLLTLSVTSVIEQESIEVSVFTSADGTTWETKPMATLPQEFYIGEYPLIIDLAGSPDAKFVRAHWDVNRWGRGANTPRFEIGLRFREIPPEMLSKP